MLVSIININWIKLIIINIKLKKFIEFLQLLNIHENTQTYTKIYEKF